MKKNVWKAFYMLLICLVCRQNGLACGFGVDPDAYHLTLLDYYLLRDCISSDFFPYDNYRTKCSGFGYIADFNDYYDYYDRNNSEEYDYTDYNLVAWQALTSSKIPHEDINAIVDVNRDTINSIGSLEKYWNTPNALPPYLVENQFVKFLVRNKRKDILTYLLFMQKCGKYTQIGYYEWDEKKQIPKDDLAVLLEEGKKLITQEKNILLRQRYLFQLVRIAKWTGNLKKGIEIYNEFFDPKMPQNYLYGRTLHHLAIGYPKEKEIGIYAKLYLIFRNTDENFAWWCYESFKDVEISNQSEFEKCLASAESDEVRSAIWTLAHFEKGYWINYTQYNDEKYKPLYEGLTFLKGSYQHNPTDINAEILLIRELQEVEKGYFRKTTFRKTKLDSSAYQIHTDKFAKLPTYKGEEISIWQGIWEGIKRLMRSFLSLFSERKKEILSTPNYRSFNVNNDLTDRVMPAALYDETWHGEENNEQKIDKQKFIEFRQFVEQVAQSNRANQPALWHLAAAYLNIIGKNFEKAGKFVKSGNVAFKNYKGQNPNILKQLELLGLYASMDKNEKIDEDIEKQIFQFAKNQKDTTFNFDKFFYSRVGQKYFLQGDFAKSILAFYRAGTPEISAVLVEMYADDTKMKELLAFTMKEQKSDFEQYLIQTTLNTNQVLEIYATQLGRDNRFEEGLEFLRQIEPTYWQTAFEFEVTIGNRYLKDIKIASYNRLEFFEMVDSLSKIASKDKINAAETYIKIGNALYSTPYWGYNDRLWQGNLEDIADFFSGNQYPFNLSDSLSTKLYIGKNKFLNRYGTGWLSGQYYQKVMELDKGKLGMLACYLGMNASKFTLTRFHETHKSDFELFKNAWLKEYQRSEGVEQILKDCPALKEMM